MDALIAGGALLAVGVWSFAYTRTGNRYNLVYAIPIVTWLVHVAVFYAVITFAPVGWAHEHRLFLNDWAKAVVFQNVIMLLVRGFAVCRLRRML